MLSEAKLREIVEQDIRTHEKLGDQTGGSGHHAYTSYSIDKIEVPRKLDDDAEKWIIEYSYTIIVETEFTYYPDNPPYEYEHEGRVLGNSSRFMDDSPPSSSMLERLS